MEKCEYALVYWRDVVVAAVRRHDRMNSMDTRGLEWIPPDPRFLTLAAWSARYYVPITFVVDALLRHYDRVRRGARRRGGLGVPLATLISAASRYTVEAAVAHAYPAHENELSRHRTARYVPLQWRSVTLDGMLAEYDAAMLRMQLATATRSGRPYRGAR